MFGASKRIDKLVYDVKWLELRCDGHLQRFEKLTSTQQAMRNDHSSTNADVALQADKIAALETELNTRMKIRHNEYRALRMEQMNMLEIIGSLVKHLNLDVDLDEDGNFVFQSAAPAAKRRKPARKAAK